MNAYNFVVNIVGLIAHFGGFPSSISDFNQFKDRFCSNLRTNRGKDDGENRREKEISRFSIISFDDNIGGGSVRCSAYLHQEICVWNRYRL